MNNSVISIDLAKNVFQVCVLNEHRVVVLNQKVRRQDLLKTISNLEPNRVVMEACYSSNYWGRMCLSLGKEVGLIPPHQVKPFVVGNARQFKSGRQNGSMGRTDTETVCQW